MPVSDYTPSVAEVASLIRARTKVRGSGDEAGTFNANTRPTDVVATESITEAIDEVAASLGPDIPDGPDPDDPDALRRAAKSAVSLLSAMNIESSFYPEQIAQDRSNYTALERRYNKLLDRLASAIEAAGGSTVGGGEEGGAGYGKPSFDFGDHDMTTMDEPH